MSAPVARSRSTNIHPSTGPMVVRIPAEDGVAKPEGVVERGQEFFAAQVLAAQDADGIEAAARILCFAVNSTVSESIYDQSRFHPVGMTKSC